jgi:hypothetical protein
MAPAHGLAILSDLLGVPSVQVQQALGREDGGEAEQECEKADVYPGETHGITSENRVERTLRVGSRDPVIVKSNYYANHPE